MKTEPIAPQMPFVWPEPRVSAGVASYSSELPFESAVRSAVTIFGVVSAVDSRANNWMKGFWPTKWSHSYRIYRELQLNLRIKPRKRLLRCMSGLNEFNELQVDEPNGLICRFGS